MDKIKELEKQIQQEKNKVKLQQIKEAEKVTGFKIGDEVEYIERNRDGDYDYTYDWTKHVIIDFDLKGDKIGLVFKYNNGYFNKWEDAKLFDKNDYTLRHSNWNRELDIDDEVQLIVDKPKSTKGDIYEIYKVIKEKGEQIEYWYFNDDNKPQTLYEGEFHVTTEKQ